MPKFDVHYIRRVAAEFLVTYLFIFTICCNGLSDARSGGAGGSLGSGVSTGFAAVALIYCFGGLSGAHFNPAVTVGAMAGLKMDIVTGLCYIAVQTAAGIAAVATLIGLFPEAKDNTLKALLLAPPDGVSNWQAFGMEFVLTFMLVMVIYGSAMGLKTVITDTDIESQDEKAELISINKMRLNFAPIAIGLALGYLCFLGGSISGGAFNPSRATAPAVLYGDYSKLLIYWGGDLLGAIVAALVYTHVLTN
jgi:aquaporin related protein